MIVKHEEFIQRQDQCLKALHDLHKNLSDTKSRNGAQVTQLKAALGELKKGTAENISKRINQVTCIVNEQLPTLTQVEVQAGTRDNVRIRVAGADQGGRNRYLFDALLGELHEIQIQTCETATPPLTPAIDISLLDVPRSPVTCYWRIKSVDTAVSTKKFNLVDSIFAQKFQEGTALIGKILIKPSPSFVGPFMRNLGEFCLRAPRKFYSNVTQV